MSVELDNLLSSSEDLMDKAVSHLLHELEKIRTGKAKSSCSARTPGKLLRIYDGYQPGSQCRTS